MAIKIRAAVIIISIVALITASSAVLGMHFSQTYLRETISDDMTVISKIAVKMFSAHLRLLKSEADLAAAECLSAAMLSGDADERQDRLQFALRKESIKRGYISLAIIDAKGVAASYGREVPSEEFLGSPYAQRAFVGERLITTTEKTAGGELVIRICVPMGSRILVATLPGLYLNGIVSEFRIWS